MATSVGNSRTSSMRAKIERRLTQGISLISPTVLIATRGLKKSATATDGYESWKNVKWAQGGSSYDWRIWKAQASGTVDSGALGTRDFKQLDLLANPSISYYMFSDTWGIGEGDLELNRHAGEQKIADMKANSMKHARNAVYKDIAAAFWNINETAHNGGLSMFSPTAAAASTTYAGISMASTNAYWYPQGIDYSTNALTTHLWRHIGAMKRQLTVSEEASGEGKRIAPDFGAMDPTLWEYILDYFETNQSWQTSGGNAPTNANLTEAGFDNIVIHGVVLYWDDNFGGSTGYVDAVATEEILVGHSDKMFIATTSTKGEGMIRGYSTTNDDYAWLRGQAGVFKTGMTAIGFESPKFFQLLYT